MNLWKNSLKLLAVFCLAVHGQVNLWQDAGFEKSGNTNDAHSGGKALEFRMKDPKYYQEFGRKTLEIEPFATYEATAFVKGSVPSGIGQAMTVYGWNSFGWYFQRCAYITKIDTWTEKTVQFCIPAPQVAFAALVLSNAEDAVICIDDLKIVRVKTAAETIAALEAKANPTAEERQLLARYYLKNKDFAKMQALMEGGDVLVKADISCLLAQNTTDLAAIKKHCIDMLSNEALRWPDGKHREKELMGKFPVAEQLEMCLTAIARNSSPSVMESLNYMALTASDTHTLAAEEQKIAEYRKAIERIPAEIRNSKNGKEALAKMDKKIDEMEAALAEHRKNCGQAVVTLGGKAVNSRAHAIVVPADATKTERRAASDLVEHLELMTSQTLEIVEEVQLGGRYPIYIGRSARLQELGIKVDYAKLGLEGIHIEVTDKAMALAGGKRGVLYATYTFLEENLGCRWFTPDCITIPKSGNFNITQCRKVYVPPLENRSTDYPCSRPLTYSVRNKYNGLYIPHDESWGGNIHYHGFVHTFNSLVPPSIYGAEHPEYYSEINGHRVVERSQLCLTNPDVLKIATETALRWCEESPDAAIISISQNDWWNYCQCEKCTALAEKEGSQAGPLLHFVNAIAREVAKKYPDKIVDTLAYQYTRKPPKFVKAEPNVAIRLCSIECCFVHPLESCPYNKSFVSDIEGWSKNCQRLHIWDYVINYAHCIMPFPNLDVLQPNIKFFIKYGVTGIYEEANYFSKGGELSELRSYLMAKCLWDPDADLNKARYEFTEAYYGAAGKHIREYLDVLHKTVCSNTQRHVRIYSSPKDYLNDENMLKRCFEIFAEAEAAVGGDAVLLHRVKVAKLPIIYTRLSLGKGSYKLYKNLLKTDDVSDAILIQEFADVVAKEKITHIREGNGNIDGWIASQNSSDLPLNIVQLKNRHLQLDVIPHAGGRIWKVTELKGGRQLLRLVGNDENGYQPLEGGVEEYSTDAHRGPGWCEPYRILDHDDNMIEMEAKLSNGRVMKRRIELVPDKAAFRVITSVSAPQKGKIVFRTHPEFAVSGTANAVLEVLKADGTVSATSLADAQKPLAEKELWLRGADCPAGEWTIVDKVTGLRIVNRFKQGEVDFCYCNWNGEKSRVNLEEWSKAVEAEANQPVTLTNEYEIKY